MPIEKERRFLVKNIDKNIILAPGKWEIKQGYLNLADPFKQFRIRIINGQRAILGVKEGCGVLRKEDEHETDMKTASFVMGHCSDFLEKTRCFPENNPPEGEWTIDFLKNPLEKIILIEFEYKGFGKNFRRPEWMKNAIEVTNSISSIHLARLATELRSKEKINLESLYMKIIPKSVHRIALTGGPDSGKSKLIEEIKIKLGSAVHCVPEVATILIRDVGLNPQYDSRKFNTSIYRIQKIFEMTSLEQAASDGKAAVVFDRGTLDIIPYEKGGENEFASLFRTNLRWEYDQYDIVICLEVPPKEIYEKTKQNNPARRETYEEAFALGEKIKKAWGGHPNFHIVQNCDDWEKKAEKALTLIKKIIKKPLF
jgi:CYTH domain-containing protein/predicted ATPase